MFLRYANQPVGSGGRAKSSSGGAAESGSGKAFLQGSIPSPSSHLIPSPPFSHFPPSPPSSCLLNLLHDDDQIFSDLSLTTTRTMNDVNNFFGEFKNYFSLTPMMHMTSNTKVTSSPDCRQVSTPEIDLFSCPSTAEVFETMQPLSEADQCSPLMIGTSPSPFQFLASHDVVRETRENLWSVENISMILDKSPERKNAAVAESGTKQKKLSAQRTRVAVTRSLTLRSNTRSEGQRSNTRSEGQRNRVNDVKCRTDSDDIEEKETTPQPSMPSHYGGNDVTQWLNQQTCDGNIKRRRRVSRTQRVAANERERRRMDSLNLAFSSLRDHIPVRTQDRRLSRIQTLRYAIDYIALMLDMLKKC